MFTKRPCLGIASSQTAGQISACVTRPSVRSETPKDETKSWSVSWVIPSTLLDEGKQLFAIMPLLPLILVESRLLLAFLIEV